MTESNVTSHADAGHDEHAHEEHITDKTFFKVFVALFVFTTISFVVNQLFGRDAAALAFIIIMAVAVCKATLVVMFFMHLKIDWRKVFVFIVPTMILAPLIVIVLWPDIVLAWRLAPTP
jgi:caa(3)-type oxidase subunit IV